jgi:hypothetical protein
MKVTDADQRMRVADRQRPPEHELGLVELAPRASRSDHRRRRLKLTSRNPPTRPALTLIRCPLIGMSVHRCDQLALTHRDGHRVAAARPVGGCLIRALDHVTRRV